MTDINLDHIQTNPKFDLKNDFEDDIYTGLTHSCKYLEPGELHQLISTTY